MFRSSWLDSPFSDPPRATQGEIIVVIVVFFLVVPPAILNYIGAFWARPDFRYTNFFKLRRDPILGTQTFFLVVVPPLF